MGIVHMLIITDRRMFRTQRNPLVTQFIKRPAVLFSQSERQAIFIIIGTSVDVASTTAHVAMKRHTLINPLKAHGVVRSQGVSQIARNHGFYWSAPVRRPGWPKA